MRSNARSVEVFYRRQLEAEGKVLRGDKTPAYIEIVPELAEMHPEARFIHLTPETDAVRVAFNG